jgi:hypothetical protein
LSPESVIQNFVSNIKSGNIDAAIKLSPFYEDDLVNKINAKEELLYMEAILPQDNLIFPYGSFRKYELISRYAFQIKFLIFSILLTDEFSELVAYSPVHINNNAEKVNRFISTLNARNLNPLELVRFDIFRPEIQFSEFGRKNIDTQKKIYGFDDKIEYTVLYSHNGKYYTGAMTVVRYGKNWYILALNSILAGTTPVGSLELISGINDYLIKFDLKE